MTPEERKLLVDTAAAVKRIEEKLRRDPWTYVGHGDPRDMHQVLKDIDHGVKQLETTGIGEPQTDAIADRLLDKMSGRLDS
jgi:hypothetical protein